MTKEELEKIIRVRMPFAIKNSKGKLKYPFISGNANEIVVEALTNGIYEELSKLSQHDVSVSVCDRCEGKPESADNVLCDDCYSDLHVM